MDAMTYAPLSTTFRLVHLRTQTCVRFEQPRAKTRQAKGEVTVSYWIPKPGGGTTWSEQQHLSREQARDLYGRLLRQGYTPQEV